MPRLSPNHSKGGAQSESLQPPSFVRVNPKPELGTGHSVTGEQSSNLRVTSEARVTKGSSPSHSKDEFFHSQSPVTVIPKLQLSPSRSKAGAQLSPSRSKAGAQSDLH